MRAVTDRAYNISPTSFATLSADEGKSFRRMRLGAEGRPTGLAVITVLTDSRVLLMPMRAFVQQRSDRHSRNDWGCGCSTSVRRFRLHRIPVASCRPQQTNLDAARFQPLEVHSR